MQVTTSVLRRSVLMFAVAKRTIFAADMYPARDDFSHGQAKRSPDARLGARCSLGGVRLTVFWEKMNAQFGEGYADSVAQDYVLAGLGGRTVNRALAEGESAKTVWRAVCEAFHVAESLR
jgi:hypothetical protein